MLKFKNANVVVKDNPVVNRDGKEVVVRVESEARRPKRPAGQYGFHHLSERQPLPRV